MKQNYKLAALILLMILVGILPLQAEEQAPLMSTTNYIIGPGDILEISVWDNKALTKPVQVLPDGKIHFPLIGEVVAGGKTLESLQKELEQKISGFVTNPNLSVMVQQVNSMLIYVVGKVNQPGRFLLNSYVNVLQMIAMAGGLNAFAKRNDIRILRETNGKTEMLLFEYDRVVEGENLAQNVRLERGDVVVVP